jgi:hypothetical protein
MELLSQIAYTLAEVGKSHHTRIDKRSFLNLSIGAAT